jgi:hypothetical protein
VRTETQEAIMTGIMPEGFGRMIIDYPRGAASLRDEIRAMLKSSIADQDSSMDTGGGMGVADLWVWVDGKEYCVTVKPTGAMKGDRT